MALDPRIKVNPDGSYFYSGSVLTGKGDLYKPAGEYGEQSAIHDKRFSKSFVFQCSHITDYGYCDKYSRVDTTVPRITFRPGSNDSFERASLGSSRDIAKTIFSEWALTPSRVNYVSSPTRRGLISDSRRGGGSHPSYGHFELTLSRSDTRCINLYCYYSKTYVGCIAIQLLNDQEASNVADHIREEREEMGYRFRFYHDTRYGFYNRFAGAPRIIELLRRSYIDGLTGWQLIEGYHCKILD